MNGSTLPSACRFAAGVAVLAIAAHTWLLMGLVTPVTVAGSSMAPTLSGPRQTFRCGNCQQDFAVGLDLLADDEAAVCPNCGTWAKPSRLGVQRGDRIVIDRTAYWFRPPRRWEVVVFHSPQDAGQLSVKRVVGLPGDTVSIANGELQINGQAVCRPGGTACEARPGDRLNQIVPWQIGPQEYFVLGDNGAVSDDSRSWVSGPGLDEKLLVGRPLGVR